MGCRVRKSYCDKESIWRGKMTQKRIWTWKKDEEMKRVLCCFIFVFILNVHISGAQRVCWVAHRDFMSMQQVGGKKGKRVWKEEEKRKVRKKGRERGWWDLCLFFSFCSLCLSLFPFPSFNPQCHHTSSHTHIHSSWTEEALWCEIFVFPLFSQTPTSWQLFTRQSVCFHQNNAPTLPCRRQHSQWRDCT